MGGSSGGPRSYLVAATVLPILAIDASYVYSLWQPYQEHVGASLDRLLVQQVPNAALLAVAAFARVPLTSPSAAADGRAPTR